MTSSHALKGGVSLWNRKVYKGIIPYLCMENTTQTAGETATESIGLTEMQEESWEDNQPSFYDLAEADGTLMYYQERNGELVSAEDY